MTTQKCVCNVCNGDGIVQRGDDYELCNHCDSNPTHDKNNMATEPTEIRLKFTLAFKQFVNIDYGKCEHFGTLVQGFVGCMKDGKAIIIPFTLTSYNDCETLIETLKDVKDIEGISFAQHYIHYTTFDNVRPTT